MHKLLREVTTLFMATMETTISTETVETISSTEELATTKCQETQEMTKCSAEKVTTIFSETAGMVNNMASTLLTEFSLAMISSMEAMDVTTFTADLETTSFMETQVMTTSTVVLERTLFTVETALMISTLAMVGTLSSAVRDATTFTLMEEATLSGSVTLTALKAPYKNFISTVLEMTQRTSLSSWTSGLSPPSLSTRSVSTATTSRMIPLLQFATNPLLMKASV